MKRTLSMLVVLALFGFATGAEAAILYKDATTTDLNTLANWSTTNGATTPDPTSFGTGDQLRFNENTAASGTFTMDLSDALSVGDITVDSGAAGGGSATGNFVINSANSSTLTLNSGGNASYTSSGIVLNSGSGGTLTINCNIALGASPVRFTASRALTVAGNIALGANTLEFNTAGSTTTISGVISGTGALNKAQGGATLSLTNAANTFSGQVTLVGGTTRVVKLATIGNNSSLGTGSGASSIIMNGATLTMDATGSGGSTNRAIDMRAGATINNDSASTISFTAANVTQGGTASARTLTLGGTNTGDNTFSSILGNSGTGANISRLQKSGASKWIVTGTQTYTGATVINQGTLYVGGSSSLGGATGSTGDESNIWFTSTNSGGALHFETVANLGAADQIRFRNTGGTVGQGGALVYVGTTAQTLSKTIQCDTSIGMRIESNSVGGKITLNGAFSQTNRGLYLGGTGTGDNDLAMNFTGSGAITKRDSGKWILSGSNTYTGGTELLGGTLEVNALSRLGNRTAGGDNTGYLAIKNGATFTYTGAGESTARRLYMDSGAATIEVTDANATLNWNDDSDSLKNGNFTKTGAGALVLADPLTGAGQTVTINDGTLTLSGTNTYTGLTTINAGTLELSGGAAIADTGAVTLADAAGATLKLSTGEIIGSLAGGGTTGGNVNLQSYKLTVGDTNDTTYAGAISGTGGQLDKQGSGKLTLTGSNAYSGTTTVVAGVLALTGTGSISSSTIIDVQSGATLDVSGTTGTYTIASGQTLKGKGTVQGGLILDSGATLAPGSSPGTLNTGSLTLSGTTVSSFELNPADQTIGSNINDLVVVTGDFTLDGLLDVTATSGDFSLVTSGTWRLFNYSGGTFTNSGMTLNSMPALASGKSWQLDTATAGQINLTVIPEPGTAGIVATFIAAALLRKRRFG